jgi:proline dehydrogenase
MLRKGLIRLGESQRLRHALTAVPLTRAMSRRFVAGETLEDFLRAAREASRQNLALTGNYLGEDVHDPEEARAAVTTYLRTLELMHGEGLDVNVSVKPSQLGRDPNGDAVPAHLERIVERAAALGGFVRIDMESSAHTRRTIELYEALHARARGHVGIVLQAYLKRTAADVERMIELRATVRLCKGAYAEPP